MMRNKYILIVTAVYPPEPVVSSRLSADLYQHLTEKGYCVKILHPKPTRPNGFDFSKEIEVSKDEIVVKSYTCPRSSMLGRLWESRSFGKAIADYIKRHHREIGCVYANTWPMLSQHILARTACKYGIPVVMHVQDVYPESLTNKLPSFVGSIFKAFLLPMDRYILRKSNKVIAISEKMKAYLVETRGIDAKKVSVVLNWQDETEFLEYQKNAIAKKQDKFTFMYMGNIGPVAGVDLLIEAFLKARLDNARLVIAGSGSMKAKLIEKASFSPIIEFWDVPNGKVPEIQFQADCMLLPIKKGAASSSIPSKLPAYMFSAKPIIGCLDKDSDTANAIKEADCGWVIEPENVEKLAETMKMVAGLERCVLDDKADNAQAFGLSHFSKNMNLRKLTDVIMKQINDYKNE